MRIRVYKIKTIIKEPTLLIQNKLNNYPVILVSKDGKQYFIDLERKFEQNTNYLFSYEYYRPDLLSLGNLMGTFEYNPTFEDLNKFNVLNLIPTKLYTNNRVFNFFTKNLGYRYAVNKCTRHFLSKIWDKL